jgi:hyperosmotically inducible periplasmic protein
MNKFQHNRTLAALAAAVAALTLAACDDNRTAGQQIDRGVQRAENKTAEVTADAKAAANRAGNAMERAGSTVADKVEDASITTAVNAEYARDDKLSAIKIDVDTKDGKVLLTGTAPDAASKDRATMLANNVKGVTAVDNQLTVKP